MITLDEKTARQALENHESAYQREWVGLKKEDVLYIGLEVEKTLGETPESYFFEFARAIEAKLKQLNQCNGSANGSSHECT